MYIQILLCIYKHILIILYSYNKHYTHFINLRYRIYLKISKEFSYIKKPENLVDQYILN